MPRLPRPGANLLYRLPALAAISGLICTLFTGAHPMLQPLVLLAVLLAPTLLPRAVLYPGPPDPPDGGDDGGRGGGRGPEPQPPEPPPAPRDGGIPLPDAEPARVRRRDHDRPRLTPRHVRRPAREPDRAPQRERSARSLRR